MRYSAEEIKPGEKKPEAPLGNHVMTCVFENPTKDGKKHSFLFKNHEYQIWFNCFPSQLQSLAEKFLVPLESDGSVDTALFKNKRAKITVDEVILKNGSLYKTCTHFEAEVEDELDIPF